MTAHVFKWNGVCVPGLSSEVEELMVEGLLLQVSVPETQQLYRLLLSGPPTTNTSHTEHPPYLTEKHSSPQREVRSLRRCTHHFFFGLLAVKVKSLIEKNCQELEVKICFSVGIMYKHWDKPTQSSKISNVICFCRSQKSVISASSLRSTLAIFLKKTSPWIHQSKYICCYHGYENHGKSSKFSLP